MKFLPKVKFTIDPKQDIKNYVLFKKYSEPKFLKMFLPAKLLNAKDEEIRKFVIDKFQARKKDIEENVKATEKLWHAVSGEFFGLADKIFKGHPWPKGRYRAYASVFQMYPRHIDEKLFYFSALRKPAPNLKTIAHEMLHFMFFDYIKEKYGVGEGKKYVWNVSETFNLAIEKWEPYRKTFKTLGRPYDAAHGKMLPKMRRFWEEREDIDYLLNYFFKK